MKGIFLVLSICFLFCSCEKNSLQPSIHYDVEGNVISHDMIVLGSQLSDPYSMENMTKAIESLYPTKAERVELEPTDIYIRYKPSNEDEFQELLDRFGTRILDHPVDYKIVKEGDYYHDPSVPEDEFTWLYTVVGLEEDIPKDIKYEVLDKVYIPDHDPGTKSGGLDWDEIEREAFRLTGNEDLLLTKTKAKAVPEGIITVYDDKAEVSYGLKGVMVSCNTFVKFDNCYTDENGYYHMNKSYTANPRYRIVYKSIYGASLGFNLILIPATYCTLGKGSPSGISLEINKQSNRVLFSRSVVMNAINDYFEMTRAEKGEGISVPPSNLRIWLFQNLDCSSAVMLHHGVFMDHSLIKKFLKEFSILLQFFMPDITLGLKGAETYDEIYTTAVHELAHSSHFVSVGKDYWRKLSECIIKSYLTSGFVLYGTGTEEDSGYCEVAEMWAYYMENQVYRELYPDSNTTFGTYYWFKPQIFLFLDDRGLNKHLIFRALSSDVNNIEILKKKLISLYPQFKSAINTAFSRYNK